MSDAAVAEAVVRRVVEQVAFSRAQAARYLGFATERSLEERPDIPWVDLRKPGAKRPLVRYMKADLDAILAARRIAPVTSPVSTPNTVRQHGRQHLRSPHLSQRRHG